MATDYDTPQTAHDDACENPIQKSMVQRVTHQPPVIDEDELEAADSFDLPGADLSAEEIQVRILPAQADEFTCAACFLVRHRSQIARHIDGLAYCSDCES